MSEYTPTTEEVRRAVYDQYDEGWDRQVARDSFDRWLRSVKAEAWAEGHAQAIANIAWPKERQDNPYK